MIQLRQYLESDHDDVWRLHTVALEDAGAHAGHGPWDDDLHDIPQVYLDDGGEFVVACIDGRIVGIGALKRTSESKAEIKRMRVHPDYQRRRIGRQILEYLEQFAKKHGFTCLHLDTTEDQTAALNFYPQNGYQETRRKKEGRFTIVFFEKSLCDDG